MSRKREEHPTNGADDSGIVDSPEIVDYVAVLIHCKDDNSYLFTQGTDGKGLWIPYTHMQETETWRLAGDRLLKELLGAATTLKCEHVLKLLRFWYPSSKTFPTGVIFHVSAKQDVKLCTLPDTEHFLWLNVTQAMHFQEISKLRSPEILELIRKVEDFNLVHQSNALFEISASQVLIGLDADKETRTSHEQLVQSAKLGRKEQELLYREFLHLCYPCIMMNKQIFTEFMTALGTPESIIPELYRSFDNHNRGALSYRDFLYGLAAMEPCTQHGGPPAELRCRYIFRVYDKNSDNKLEYAEFKKMVADIRHLKGVGTTPEEVNQEADSSAQAFGAESGDSLAMNEFLTGVGQLKFRGTSLLLRLPMSVIQYIKQQRNIDDPKDTREPVSKRSRSMNLIDKMETTSQFMHDFDIGGQDSSLSVAGRQYELATHTVKVRRSGTVIDVNALWDLENSAALNKSFKIQPKLKFERTFSVDSFNKKSQPNEMLNGLRYFERAVKRDTNEKGAAARVPKESYDWGQVDKAALGRCIIALCRQCKDILSQEPRLLVLHSPTYILGDLHGNFRDLVYFEKTLWRLGPILTPANFLFLGDYVDRGEHGVEVVSYLFAQKILSPTRFHMLRGNHEIREVQQMFTFYRECFTKFGEKQGREIWEAVNSVFDVMPLAAVVDGKVFCAHGGIPPPWIGSGLISTVNTIPNPLPNPEEQSKLAWEIMWSDPINPDSVSSDIQVELHRNQGFAANVKRGTAHVFSTEALETFLSKNNLSHVVRAHEVQQAGFQIHQRGKLLTVFSSSHYCGGSNEAACVLADGNKLRFICLDTS